MAEAELRAVFGNDVSASEQEDEDRACVGTVQEDGAAGDVCVEGNRGTWYVYLSGAYGLVGWLDLM